VRSFAAALLLSGLLLGAKLLTGHRWLHVACAMILPEAAKHELKEDAIHAVSWHGLDQTVSPSEPV